MSVHRLLSLLVGAIPLIFLVGCTSYEYDIVSPPDLRQHIGTKDEVVARVDPMEYRLLSVEDHLILQVYNRTADMIQFLGEYSSVVDAAGQSHPMRGQAIPPGAFMKLVLPPMPRYERASGPHLGVGIGIGGGRGYGGPWRDGLGFDDPMVDEPRRVAVYDSSVGYWEWQGETDIRLLLSFQHGIDKPVTHQWTFHRKKM